MGCLKYPSMKRKSLPNLPEINQRVLMHYLDSLRDFIANLNIKIGQGASP